MELNKVGIGFRKGLSKNIVNEINRKIVQLRNAGIIEWEMANVENRAIKVTPAEQRCYFGAQGVGQQERVNPWEILITVGNVKSTILLSVYSLTAIFLCTVLNSLILSIIK